MDNIAVKYSVFAFGLMCVLAGVIACLADKVAGGGIVIAAGLVLILLSQFEIESFKMPGLEAKLRKTLVKAEVTLDALRKIAVPISEVSISLAARNGRIGTASSHQELYNLSMRIKDELLEIQVVEDDINKVLHEWYFFTTFDMGRLISAPFTKLLREKQKQLNKDLQDWIGGKPISDHMRHAEMLEQVNIARREIEEIENCLWKQNYQDIPEVLRTSILNSITLNNHEKDEFWKKYDEQWKDLTYFVKHKELRRKEDWFAAEVQ